MAVLAIVVADLHLRPRIWRRHQIEGDSELILSRIISYAETAEAAAIIFAGDTLDPPNSWSIDVLHKALADFQGKVFGIQGQHDWSNPSWFAVHGFVGSNLSCTQVRIGEFLFSGIDNLPRHQLKRALAAVPAVDFLIVHQLVSSVVPWESWNLDPEWIPQHVKSVISGDLHKPCTFELPNGNTGFYVGSPFPQNKAEIASPHGFLVVQDDGSVHREVIQVRSFRRLFVETQDDLDKLEGSWQTIYQNLPDRGLPPAVFIDYNPLIPEISERVAALCRHTGVFVVSEPLSVLQESDVELPDLAQGAIQMQDLVNRFTDDPRVQELVVALLKDCRMETVHRFRRTQFPQLEESKHASE